MSQDQKFFYHTQDVDIILKEYGRNVQRIVNHIKTLDDREERTQSAHALIDLMRQLNPNYANAQDYQQKLWDDLFIMAEFELEVDSPFPLPEPSMLGKKPQRMEYRTGEVRYKHYGRNVELLIDQAAVLEDDEEREAAIIYLGKLMKGFYAIWNKENIEDEVIVEQIKELSQGRLDISVERVKAQNLFNAPPIRDSRDSQSLRENHHGRNSNRGNRNQRRKRR